MAAHNELGKRGEDLVAVFLTEKNYLILEKNWRFRRAEVDIIAQQENILVFVEVKTRSDTFFGEPADFFDEKKEQLMTAAAEAYCEQAAYDGEIRFDLVSVVLRPRRAPEIAHFEDVFFPGWGSE